MKNNEGLHVSTYQWAKQLAENLNRWATNSEKRGYFNRSYKLFNARDKHLFTAGFNDAIEYDYEFTDDNF